LGGRPSHAGILFDVNASAPPYDLVIRGGEVIDPASAFLGPADVAVAGGRIAAVGRDLDPALARRVIDADDLLVCPGLIDLHTHAFAGGGFWGVDPDVVGPRTGVTTWVDAGSAGAFNIASLLTFADSRRTSRVVPFINISPVGLVAPTYELMNLDACDPDLVALAAATHPGQIAGVKVRMGIPIAGRHGLDPLRRARDAAERIGRPLMVHIAQGPPAIDAVLDLLRPGDVVTHAFTGLSMRLVDERGRLLDAVRSARERGVLLDLGHGSRGFTFGSAIAVLDQGVLPDVISTDVHQLSINGPMFDLTTCMTKLLDLGMSLDAVVSATTRRPAEILRMTDAIGTLAVGAIADITLLKVESGRFPLFDCDLQTRIAERRLVVAQTIYGGRPVEPPGPSLPEPWIQLTPAQQRYYDAPGRGALVDAIRDASELGTPPAPYGPAEAVLAEAERSFGLRRD
jgi:dihydroorotase